MGRNDNHKRDFAGWTAKQFTWAMLCGHIPPSGPAAPIGDHSDSIAICTAIGCRAAPFMGLRDLGYGPVVADPEQEPSARPISNVTDCNAQDVTIGMKVSAGWTPMTDDWVMPHVRQVWALEHFARAVGNHHISVMRGHRPRCRLAPGRPWD